MEESKLRLISGGKSTQQPSSTQKTTPQQHQTNLSLLKTLSKFDDSGEAKVETLVEYEDITYVLRESGMSFKTRIIRYKKSPTKYYVTLLEEL